MSSNVKSRIEEFSTTGYNFKFGDYISTGFSLLQKNLGGFVIFTFIFLVVVVVVNFIPFIGALANQFLLIPAFSVGAYLVANKLHNGFGVEFGDFTKGFDHAGQLALTSMAITAITIFSLIPFFWSIKDSGIMEWYQGYLANPLEVDELPQIPKSSLLLLIPAIYFNVAYNWSYLFVAFYKMSFWDAMEASRKIITKKWFTFLIFFIVLGLLAGVGLFLFCIGLLATIPAYFCMNYAAFEDVMQLRADTSENEAINDEIVD